MENSAQRTALVTGGGRGIGREICFALAAAGRAIAVADILTEERDDTAETIRATDGVAMAIEMDVTDTADVDRAVASVREALGPIAILVNCAGWDRFHRFVETEETFWDRLIELNYKGVLRTTRVCLPEMMEGRWGRIVNLSSDAARVGSSLEAVYSGTKGAVISFTKTIAREAARSGVTANVVCPGPTDTRLLAEIVEQDADSDRVIAAMTRAVPMRRLASPREVAMAVAFFTSEDAGFITGQTLSVSGGLTMA